MSGPATPTGLTEFPIIVLLVDDQPIIGEAVRRMLDGEKDITFHFCNDPTKALAVANEVRPTVILQDLVMPDVDGLMLVKFFRAGKATRDIPLIVLSSKEEPIIKAEAFAVGANDYLVKLPDRVELLARIRYHSRGYIGLLQRNEAYEALAASEKKLVGQIAAAAKFVRSLLPAPRSDSVRADWRFVPSASLGGDTLGYEWLDDDYFAVYIIDVTGHGLNSALFSVTIMNVLRSRALANADFRRPGTVLAALNDAFQMENYDFKCFTIWYGVYRKSTGILAWASGGHPEALLFDGAGPPLKLKTDSPMMGMMPWPNFETHECPIAPGSRLYVYTDGVFEIMRPDAPDWTFAEFVDYLASLPADGESPMDAVLQHVRTLHGTELLDDDFTMIEVRF